MRVADEEMAVNGLRACRHQGLAQPMAAGATIQDDQCAGSRADLHAGRVATIAQGTGPGLGKRAACSPETDAHEQSPSREGHTRASQAFTPAYIWFAPRSGP